MARLAANLSGLLSTDQAHSCGGCAACSPKRQSFWMKQACQACMGANLATCTHCRLVCAPLAIERCVILWSSPMQEIPAPVSTQIAARSKTAQSAPEAALIRIPMSLARSPDLGNSNLGEAACDGFLMVSAGSRRLELAWTLPGLCDLLHRAHSKVDHTQNCWGG